MVARRTQEGTIPLGRHDGVKEQMQFIFIPAETQGDPLLAEPITVGAVEAPADRTGGEAGKGPGQVALVEGVVVRTDDRQCMVEVRPAGAAARIGKSDLAVLR